VYAEKRLKTGILQAVLEKKADLSSCRRLVQKATKDWHVSTRLTMPDNLRLLPTDSLPLKPFNPVGPDTRSPLLKQRAMQEIAQIEKVKKEHATRTALVSLQAEEPVGIDRLLELAKS
jgi:hypothetical protein